MIAKISPAVKIVDIPLNQQTLLNEMYYRYTAGLVIDSKITLKMSTCIRVPAESLYKVALATIREAFHPTLFFFIGCFPGFPYAADSLKKKDGHAAASNLSRILRHVIYPRHPSETDRLLESLDAFLLSY